ncbi:MAG: TIGR03668 family PPOX class F420-dependent oxidoreductase, partial [Acidimicrobiia bacterium]
MTSEAIRARVAAAPVGRLATTRPDGRVHLVPCCFALSGDLAYSAVDRKPKRSPRLERLSNIGANPSVTLLVDHYEEDWSRLWWVVLEGRARVIEAGPESDSALS